MTRLWSAVVLVVVPLAAEAQQCPGPLTFNGGTFGPVPVEMTAIAFTPSGGAPPYRFELAPGAPAIAGFRIANRPDVPSWFSPSQTGALIGVPQGASQVSETNYTTVVRLRDNNGALCDRSVTIRVSPLDVTGWGPDGYAIGDAVRFFFQAQGGTPPYTYATTAGSLPDGLTMNSATGEVSGTLTTAGVSNWTLRVTDSNGVVLHRGQSMAVNPLRINIANRILPHGVVNQSYSHTFVASGGTGQITFSLAPFSSLPNGLTLSPTGLLSGTPTGSTYAWHFTLRLTDGAGAMRDVRYAISVLPQVPTPLTVSTTLGSDVIVGEDRLFGLYAFGGLPPYTFEFVGANPPGSTIHDYRRLPTYWDPVDYFRIQTPAPGTWNFTIRVTDSAGNQSTRNISVDVYNFGLFHRWLPVSGTIALSAPYEQYLVPAGGTPPYTLTTQTSIAGMTLSNDGRFVGTPQETGLNLPFRLFMADSTGTTAFLQSDIDILAGATANPLSINGGDGGTISVGNVYNRVFTVSNSPLANPGYALSIVSGSLPPGLQLLTGNKFNNSENPQFAGMIAGIPTTPGSYEVILRATDSLGNVGQRAFRMTVSSMNFVGNNLPSGTVGRPYSAMLDVRGGTNPKTYSLPNSGLPAGLTLNSSTGEISGTPTTTSALSITFEVRDASGASLQRNYTINIYPLEITTPSVLPMGILGRPYSHALTAVPSGSYSWSANGLPSGLSLNSGTGVISGTPSQTGTFNVQVTTGTSSFAVVKNFTLYVFTLQSLGNITGLPTQSLGDFGLGTSLNVILNIFGGRPPYSVSLVGGTLPPGLAIVRGDLYQGTSQFGRWAIGGIPTSAGTYNFRLRYTDSTGLQAERTLSMTITRLGLATTNLQAAEYGQPYSFQLTGVGGTGTYTFALADLLNNAPPPGITLSSTGLLSGTPTSTGNYGFTVQLTSGTLTRRITLTLRIDATTDGRFVTLNFGPVLGDLAAGRGASFTLTPTGGAGSHAWSIVSGSLPPGLALLADSNLPSGFFAPNALISGVPRTPGSYPVRIRVDDATGNFAVRDATFIVTPLRAPGPVNVPYTLSSFTPPAQVGQPYSFVSTCINGVPPCTYTLRPGSWLPSGLTFSSTGVLSGTPTESGNGIVNFIQTDANGNTLRTARGIEVFPAGKPAGPAGLNNIVLQSATVGQPYSVALEDMLFLGPAQRPIHWSLDSGSLPPGMSLTAGTHTASAVLTGTPTTPGFYQFGLVATEAATGRQHLTWDMQITVSALGVAPPDAVLPPAISGQPYSQTLAASGGTPPYTFENRFNGDMPLGMSLSPAGVLSGTPTTVTAYPFAMQILGRDSAGSLFLKRYTLNVAAPNTVLPAISVAPTNISQNYTIGNVPPPSLVLNVGSTSTQFSWTAVASASTGNWLSVSPGGGSTPGSATVSFNVAGLPAGTYFGAVTITSASAVNSPVTVPVTLTVTAAAACTYAVTPGVSSMPAEGGNGGLSVATGSGCNWSASASAPWIHLTSAGSGTGDGSVSYSVDPNAGASTRTGTITVQGFTHTITQFGANCAFVLSPGSLAAPAAAGVAQLTVSASAQGCNWNANSGVGWLTFNGASSGVGSGSVQVAIAPNPGSASRTGTVTVNGQSFTVQQAGVGCSYSLSSASESLPAAGGSTSVNLTAPAGCAWSTDPGPGWITVTSGPSGSGNGAVGLDIAPNSTTASRSATVSVGGQPLTITQAGVPCSFSVSATNTVLPSSQSNGTITIGASGPACAWTAVTNAPWLQVNPASGNGSGSISFGVAANGMPAARTATITVAGQNVVLNQSGTVCDYSLRSPSGSVPHSGGVSSVGVIAAGGCTWTASRGASWLNITAGAAGSGSQDVVFSAEPNPTGAPRTGLLTIAGIPFAVTQPAAPCTINLNPSSSPAPAAGGNGTFTYTTSVSACAHTVESYASWLKVTNAIYSGTSGSVTYTVDVNPAGQRTGSIKVGGVNYSVTQAASPCVYTLTSFAALIPRTGGDGTAPMNVAPASCGAPAVIVNGPPGMVTLGPAMPGTGTFTQHFSVSPYVSLINFVRTTQLKIQGQIFTVKQPSY